MKFKIISLLQKNRLIRLAALAYGLIFFNMGAMILYDKFTAPELVIDDGFKGAVLFCFLGLLALYAVVRAKQPVSNPKP